MHPWSLLKDDGSASPFLLVHRARGQPVLVHHAFGVEVGKGHSFLYVRQHGRVTHPEPAVLTTSAPTVGEHVQERVVVDIFVKFTQSFGAVFLVAPKQLYVLLHNPKNPSADHSTLNRTGVLLSYSTARRQPTGDQ